MRTQTGGGYRNSYYYGDGEEAREVIFVLKGVGATVYIISFFNFFIALVVFFLFFIVITNCYLYTSLFAFPNRR
jgi:hypothetical protein